MLYHVTRQRHRVDRSGEGKVYMIVAGARTYHVVIERTRPAAMPRGTQCAPSGFMEVT